MKCQVDARFSGGGVVAEFCCGLRIQWGGGSSRILSRRDAIHWGGVVPGILR